MIDLFLVFKFSFLYQRILNFNLFQLMTTASKLIKCFIFIIALTLNMSICQQMDLVFISSDNGTDSDPQTNEEQQTQLISVSQRWGFGFLAGFAISLIGFLTALVIVWCKHMASDYCFEMTIKFLFSLAFGALLGDAMIHILPEAYASQDADFRIVSAIFIGAIVFFLILERLFAACGITHKHWHNDDCHDDHQGAIENHNHPRKIANEEQNKQNLTNTIKVHDLNSNNQILEDNQCKSNKCKSDSHHKHDHSHDHAHKSPTKQEEEDKKSCLQNLKGKGSAGYMNLLGSLIHNFMDGLALGVGFATGDPKIFVPILVAIIAHEIPRQMGDVAILMTNEFNSTQTVLCNGFVNLISLLGVIIGLAITDLSEVTKTYILVFVAGNFIFIAADIWRNLFKNSGFSKNLIEFIGFGIGVAAMYLILLLESDEEQ